MKPVNNNLKSSNDSFLLVFEETGEIWGRDAGKEIDLFELNFQFSSNVKY